MSVLAAPAWAESGCGPDPASSGQAAELGPIVRDSAAADLPPGARELGVVATGAFSVIAMGGLEPEEVAGRRLALFSLRYGRVLVRRESFALEYYGDLTPLVVETADLVPAADGSERLERETAFGAGVAPLGLRLTLRPGARLRPYVGLSGGVMFLSEEVPLPGSRHYAFSGDLEAGVRYRLGPEHALTAGLRFHHISNADTGDTNPGLNALAIFVGLSAYR